MRLAIGFAIVMVSSVALAQGPPQPVAPDPSVPYGFPPGGEIQRPQGSPQTWNPGEYQAHVAKYKAIWMAMCGITKPLADPYANSPDAKRIHEQIHKHEEEVMTKFAHGRDLYADHKNSYNALCERLKKEYDAGQANIVRPGK